MLGCKIFYKPCLAYLTGTLDYEGFAPSGIFPSNKLIYSVSIHSLWVLITF